MVLGDIDDSQIVDMENFTGGSSDTGFSRTLLVMAVCRKCLETGCREMRAGYFNEKSDKFGNITKVYIEDSRKAFIEAVETLEVLMEYDLILDEDYIEDLDKKIAEEIKKGFPKEDRSEVFIKSRIQIKDIKDALDKRFKKLCEAEMKDWESCNIKTKQARWNSGITYTPDYLNINLQYYQMFISEQVHAYRNIWRILIRVTDEAASENYRNDEIVA